MQVLKKIVSLLLVAAMISSLALVAFAAEASGADEKVGLKLCAFDSKGEELAAGTELAAGDTIKVQVKTTKAVTINNLDFFVRYDKEVLESKTDGYLNEDDDYIWKTGTLVTATVDRKAAYNILSSKRNDGELKIGQSAWKIMFTKDKSPVSFSADDVLWEMNFTARNAAPATQLEVLLNTAQRLNKLENGSWDITPVDIDSEFTTENLSLAVKGAPVAVESIALSRTAYTLSEYKTYKLNATVSPEDAQVTWESSDSAVATVDQTGLVTCVSHKNGAKTTITAKAGDKSATCVITVKVVPAKSITLSDMSVNLGNSATLNATFKPYNNTSKPATTWEVIKGSDIVELTGTGASVTVTGKKTGTATVQATLGDLKPATCVVSVINPVTNVDITGPSRMLVGSTAQLTADVKIANDTAESTDDTTVTWSSQNPEIATVDENGNVTAKSNVGAATITAKVAAKEATHVVYVVTQVKDTYVVSMPQDETIAAGADVSIPVTVGRGVEGVSHYSAFDMSFTYDPAALELKTSAIDGYEVRTDAAAGTVRVIGYGDPKAFGTAFTLVFAAKQVAGDTTVKLVTAKVDISENALAADAPDAKITDSDTKLTVEVRHTVTLPTDMSGSSWVISGSNYTFSVSEYDPFYDYTVTATMNGENVTVTPGENGTYTIANVTGDLVIEMTKAGKQFSVTFEGNAKDEVTNAAAIATHGTDYTFKLTKEDKFQYTFKTTIGGVEYTVTGPDAEDNYKILGSAIKGDITITVTKKPLEGKIFDVSVEGSGKGDVTAPNQAIEDGDFVFTVVEEDGYIYSVAVSINGSDYTKLAAPVVSGNAKTYTIPGADVTGPIVIAVTKDKAVNVTFENANPGDIRIFKENGTTRITDNKDLAKEGSDYVFKVNGFFMVYDLKVEITENGTGKTFDEVVSGKEATRRDHTFTIKNVKGDLNIKLSCVANDDLVEVMVNPYVELDGKTVYIIATRTKAGYQQGIKLDTYDGYAMYTTNLYVDRFENPLTGSGSTFLWLTVVNKGEEFGVEQALQHLSYTNFRNPLNYNEQLPKPDGLANNADVNGSNLIDVNDAQLVYDIYKGAYQSFYMTNTSTNGTHVDSNYGIGASMTKFLEADVNRDMKIDLTDAAAIVNLIK